MPTGIIELVLGGTLLTSLGAGIKYLVDLWRSSRQGKTPLAIATSTTAAAEGAVSLMQKVNDELVEANSRLSSDNEVLRSRLQAANEREDKLRAEVERLEGRVHDLEDSIRALSGEITAFKDREFPAHSE